LLITPLATLAVAVAVAALAQTPPTLKAVAAVLVVVSEDTKLPLGAGLEACPVTLGRTGLYQVAAVAAGGGLLTL
jgi:uncharacterized protein involved in exopolysaccharide biosynthesis